MRKLSFFNALAYIKLLRTTNWFKNIFVFVPIVFSKHLFDISYVTKVIIAFFAFSFVSSLVYVFNDIIDVEKDKLHPHKKNRPIANGIISKKNAFVLLLVLLIIALVFTIIIANEFVFMLWLYVLINVLYTLYLKEMVIIDIFCIAAGFLLRVVGGALIISIYISNWLILTTIFISLFLGVMKRRVEIANNPSANEQRIVLKDYSLGFIDQIAAITSSGVIISYALYTVAERTVQAFGSEKLVFTTLFVIFGIFRYMYLVYKKDKGENVIEVLITDIPMLINLFLFTAVTLLIIYL